MKHCTVEEIENVFGLDNKRKSERKFSFSEMEQDLAWVIIRAMAKALNTKDTDKLSRILNIHNPTFIIGYEGSKMKYTRVAEESLELTSMLIRKFL